MCSTEVLELQRIYKSLAARHLLESHEPSVQREHGDARGHGVQVDLCPLHLWALPALLPEQPLGHRLVEEPQRLHSRSSLNPAQEWTP